MLFLIMYYKKQILFCKDDVVTNKALVLLMGPLHGRLVMALTFDIKKLCWFLLISFTSISYKQISD